MIEVKVAEGYKQTEVGVIPKDWQVKDIGEALTIKHGKDQKQVESAHGQYPIFGTGGQMGWANNFLYNRPSVLIGRKGSINKPRYINVPFWTVDTLFYSQVHNGYDEKFMFYKFCLIDWMNYNEASGVPSLNASTISNVKISVPEKQEQTAIATALSDVDNLIQSLEKLIAKKEAIKMGTMQQLLTGKTRLPEFATRDDGSPKGFKQTELGRIPEDWDYLTLDSMANVRGGKRLPKGKQLVKAQTKHPYIRVADMFMGGVDTTNMLYLTEDTAPLIKNYRIFSNELFISVAGTIGLIGKIPAELDKANLTENADRICNIQGDSSYLLYYLSSQKVQDKILSQITVGAQPKLAIQRINSLDILSPNSIEEQTAIATILVDMDAEIQALQQRLEKTKDIKQGMMQQLLTGKVRLAH